MMSPAEALTEPSRCDVSLCLRACGRVWAGGYSEGGDDVVFGSLARVTPQEQEGSGSHLAHADRHGTCCRDGGPLPRSSVARVRSAAAD